MQYQQHATRVDIGINHCSLDGSMNRFEIIAAIIIAQRHSITYAYRHVVNGPLTLMGCWAQSVDLGFSHQRESKAFSIVVERSGWILSGQAGRSSRDTVPRKNQLRNAATR